MMTMKNRHIAFLPLLLSLVMLLAAGCGSKEQKPARLQLLSMIPGQDARATVTAVNGDARETFTLPYTRPSGYRDFKPGRYRVRLEVQGRPLLDHRFVLGANSAQTLLAAGMLPDSLRTNPQTNWYKARKIVAGSENFDPNGYLPRFVMLRDRWEGSKGKGLIRLVNASPFADKLSVKDDEKTLMSALAYPKFGEPMKLKPGAHPIRLLLGKIPVGEHLLQARAGYLHTLVAGNARGDSLLPVATYQTETRALKK